MAESFLSTIWYRVANLQPRLRSHVKVHRHRYRGRAWYVLHDHASGRVHRFTPGAYMLIGQMDGGRTVDDVWRALAEAHDEDAPSQDEVIRLLSQLHQNDLIQYAGSPDVTDLLERYNKNARQLMKQNLTNPMSFRVPLIDPDRILQRTLPVVRPFLGWFGLLLWAVVIALGAAVGAMNWDALSGNFSDQLLSAQNLIIMAIAYPLLKLLHELAHGWLIRKHGGEVREMGIMFLVFFPVPYVDASNAAAFRSKWARAAISAGGIFVETFVAALAVIIWAAAEPGMVRAVAYNLVVIGGVSTVLVNGNPLLKFDGYYVLADLLEIPNFAQRANKYWGHIVQRHVFRANQLKEEVATAGEKAWFLIYAPAAYVYRLVIMVGIALFVAQKFFVIGILLALWSVFNSVVKPSFKALRHVLTSPQLRKVRSRAVSLTFGALVVALAALLFVPLPLRTVTDGVVWLPEDGYLRAGTNATVVAIDAAQGKRISKDVTIIRLEDAELRARLDVLGWQAEEARRRLAISQVRDRRLAAAARVSLVEAEAALAREHQRLEDLTVRAPISGTFEPALPPETMTGRRVNEGDLLGYILPGGPRQVRALVRQDDITLVQTRLEGASLMIQGKPEVALPATLIRAVPQATDQLPAPALSSMSGGRFLVDPTDPEGLRLLDQAFIFDFALPDEMADAPFGTRALVRFEHGTEPAAFQIFRRVRQLFLRQFNA
ncbi:PqqD family peptide modification chaperone [Roseobacteraceae bacterium S113]